MKLKATSFATDQDLVAYRQCRAAGNTDEHCTSTDGGGDNGEGAWGDDTTSRMKAFCAFGKSLQKKHQRVQVTLTTGGKTLPPFECLQGDKGNEGVCDLNPGALLAAGLDPNAELNCSAEVEFLD